jgi:hypothetical protein
VTGEIAGLAGLAEKAAAEAVAVMGSGRQALAQSAQRADAGTVGKTQ